MPIIAGFDKLASVPEEQITEKIRRRVISGKQGTMVYWSMKAGAHVAAHQHPHEQFVWVIKGTIRFRIGGEERTIKPEGIFAPVREDFLTGEIPPYLAQR